MTPFATTDLLVRHHQHELHEAAGRHRLAHSAPSHPGATRRALALAARAATRAWRGRPLVLVERSTPAAPSRYTATEPDRWMARSSVPR